MKKIGISQRLDYYPSHNELREGLDVNLNKLIYALGFIPIPLTSSISTREEYLNSLNLEGFILSGGNDIGRYTSRDDLEKAILNFSMYKGLPVLGICRGMQYINHFQGGELVEVEGHVGTRHSSLKGEWAEKFNMGEINSYHNFGIKADGLGNGLVSLVSTKDGVIEALCHEKLPWLGIMWHPERMQEISSWDIEIFTNHFS